LNQLYFPIDFYVIGIYSESRWIAIWIRLLKIFTLFAVLCLCALPAEGAAKRKSVLKGPMPVEVLGVLDGDTFSVRAQVWLGQDITVLVRIRGIDAPEMKARCAKERTAATAATEALSALLNQSSVQLVNVSGEKYFGRVLADVVTGEDGDPAVALLAKALVRPYQGKKRQPWC
jgi:endonuclease YncB( thermonuclease family)